MINYWVAVSIREKVNKPRILLTLLGGLVLNSTICR
jgi:hypothetical protein